MQKKKVPDKSNSQFKHPLPRRWLVPYLMSLSDMFDKRWSYWINTIEKGSPLDDPIPKIKFLGQPEPETKKNLKDCIQVMMCKGYNSHDSWMAFIEWILWGLGATLVEEFPSKVSEDVSWKWYTDFNMGLLMKYPHDYMAWGSCELANMSFSGNKNGYFPTPQHVVKMMTEMTMTEADKTKKMSDCCMGTGVMMLEASNYCLRLYGNDVDLNMVKMATVNAWLYMPWVACPGDGWIDWNTVDDYKKAERVLQEYHDQIKYHLPMIEYKPKSEGLSAWI